jgi:hypothetical protein
MTVYDLIDKYSGVILSNKARVQVDGKTVIVGVFENSKLVLTPEGEALAASGTAPAAVSTGIDVSDIPTLTDVAGKPAVRTRKAGLSLVDLAKQSAGVQTSDETDQ